jgi:hypothetical protein
MTQALSTRLKLSLDPLVYAYDTPGVMLPYLGRGFEGAERGVKLALIGMWNERISWTGVTHSSSLSAAGIKEGLYDIEALAAYLLYRLNTINSICEFLSFCSSDLLSVYQWPNQIYLPGTLSSLFKLNHHSNDIISPSVYVAASRRSGPHK